MHLEGKFVPKGISTNSRCNTHMHICTCKPTHTWIHAHILGAYIHTYIHTTYSPENFSLVDINHHAVLERGGAHIT